MCSLKSAGPIIGPASIISTEIPRSASTLVTVPPPAPDPITTTSWTVELVACGIDCSLEPPAPRRRPSVPGDPHAIPRGRQPSGRRPHDELNTRERPELAGGERA